MSVICPTITESTLQDFNKYLEVVATFAPRIHLDFADGEFAPTKLINVIEAHWPDDIHADFHIMYEKPLSEIETIIAKHPNLVIFHAESHEAARAIDEANSVRIPTGLALLPDTEVSSATQLIERVDHVLVFGGHLGYQGGKADLGNLAKIKEIREIKPEIEISWDGGANLENVAELQDAGVDVINVGGAIKNAPDPKEAYVKLLDKVTK